MKRKKSDSSSSSDDNTTHECEHCRTKLNRLNSIEKDLAERQDELKNEKIKLEETLKSLSEREERMVELEKKLSSSTSIECKLGKNQIVKLNVGGKIFATNIATLKSVKDTFFTGYFNDLFNPQPEEEDNAYFIDRPCEQFHLILNHLRGIDIKHKIENFNENDLIDFIEEVVYYQIIPIYELLPKKGRNILKSKYGIVMDGIENVEFDPKYCSTNIQLETKTRIKKMGATGTRTVLGTKSNHFKVKLIANCKFLMIGFAPKTIDLNAHNYNKCGYYLCTYKAELYSQNGGKSYANLSEIQDGSIVECELKDGNISYIVNGINYGVAYSNIPNEPELFPAFDIYNANCELELINE